jgi:hypothetical protein
MMVDWNRVLMNQARGMDPMRAYREAEGREREEHRRRLERLYGGSRDGRA